jgi:hypothetical protein
MSLEASMTPDVDFVDPSCKGVPLRHTWNPDVALAIQEPLPDEHLRLARAFVGLNLRAAFAVLVAQVEWVCVRFDALGDTRDLSLRLEAGYAGVIHPFYAHLPAPTQVAAPDDAVAGPLRTAARLLARGHHDYSREDVEVKQSAFCMALLLRHVLPDDHSFEQWLTRVLQAACTAYPEKGEHPMRQRPIPRSFFSDLKALEGPGLAASLQARLASLRPEVNPYLLTPQAMMDMGYPGQPYQYP